MKLARVAGTVTSTFNAPVFDDRKLLVCDLVAPDGAPTGGYLIAVDTVGAGPGELVLLLDEGGSARQILGSTDGPVRTVIVGIVDAVEQSGEAAPPRGSTPPSTPPVRRPARARKRPAAR